MKYIISILTGVSAIVVFLTYSTWRNSQPLVIMEDIAPYLETTDTLNLVDSEISFWEKKYQADTLQISYLSKLAGAYGQKFEMTGDIDLLKKAESCLLIANTRQMEQSAGILRALARNFISQHRFLEAQECLEKALALGEKKRATKLMLFDVFMELGRYNQAETTLRELAQKNDFDYLIRFAKWNDHRGRLDQTIAQMHLAELRAEKSGNRELKVWLYSNLGDFYGHAGKVKKAYRYYLQTLETDPGNWYAIKGLAWIAYAADHNVTLAKQLATLLTEKHQSPDLYLFLAEMAAYEGYPAEAEAYTETYLEKVQDPSYGAMYNKYNCLLYAERPDDIEKAITIANQEIDHRPTPMSYDLLAWSLYQKGDWQRAKEIADRYVYQQTGEPEALFHLAHIYRKAGENELVENIKNELAGSSFELGPLVANEIGQL